MSKGKILKAAVLAAVVGGIASYLFHPQKGEANRAKVKAVSKKVIARIKTEVDQVSNITKPHYERIVNKVVRDFKEDKALSADAWDELAVALKSRWLEIKDEVQKQIKPKSPAAKIPRSKKA